MTENRVFILLTNTGTLFTKSIKLYTKNPYNHASISLNSDLTEVYSFGRKHANNPFIGGFVKEEVKKDLFKHADCIIYSLTVTDEQVSNLRSMIKQFEVERESYRYNLLGLFGFIFNKPIQRKNAYFCSQFVATLLQQCNIVDFEKPLSLIAPSDLRKVSTCELVYEGKLKCYLNKDESASVLVSEYFIPFEL